MATPAVNTKALEDDKPYVCTPLARTVGSTVLHHYGGLLDKYIAFWPFQQLNTRIHKQHSSRHPVFQSVAQNLISMMSLWWLVWFPRVTWKLRQYAKEASQHAFSMLRGHTYVPLRGVIVRKPVYCRYTKRFYSCRQILHYLAIFTLFNLFLLLSFAFTPSASLSAVIMLAIGISGTIPSYKKRGYLSKHYRDLHAGLAYISAAAVFSGIPLYSCVAFVGALYFAHKVLNSFGWGPCEARAKPDRSPRPLRLLKDTNGRIGDSDHCRCSRLLAKDRDRSDQGLSSRDTQEASNR